MTTDLVRGSLMKTIDTKRPAPELIHHFDRGAQYYAQDYQAQLRRLDLIPSMSRKGNCYDNAPMESFWGTLKNERGWCSVISAILGSGSVSIARPPVSHVVEC